jgi:hypothetical protein
MRRTWLVATWLGATALASWLTFQALASAEEGVGDSTLPPVVVAATDTAVDGSTSEGVTETSRSDTTVPGTTAAEGVATTTSSSATTASTAGTPVSPPAEPTTSSSTTTVTAPSTAPATTAAAVWETRVVSSGGGTVTVRYRPGEVEYQAAVPAPGFAVEIDERSPEVRVEFVGEDAEWDVRVRWNDGALDIDVGD